MSSLSNEARNKIIRLLNNFMDRLITRMTVENPFKEDEIETNNPFGYRLVPIEVWKGSKFERSFVSSLGKRIFEKIACIIAEGTDSIAINEYRKELTINTWRLEKIDDLIMQQRSSRINDLRERNLTPDWEREVNKILSLDNPRYETVDVLFDVYIRRRDGREEYYSFKTVKPNLDQTEIAKRNMLRLISAENVDYSMTATYFALPYNPAGEGNSYSNAGHSYPYRLFRMDDDPCVLIGSKLWNKIGENENCYDELLGIFEKVGRRYEQLIRKKYFGLD